MEIGDLFKILASYLNFTIDLLCSRGMEQYAGPQSVNSDLVSFFVTGVLIAYIIGTMKRVPTYGSSLIFSTPETDSAVSSVDSGSVRDEDRTWQMSEFVIVSLVVMAMMHPLLLAWHALFGTQIGTMKDTLNAAFAVGAVQHPAEALLAQLFVYLRRTSKFLNEVFPRLEKVFKGNWIPSLIAFPMMYYPIYALAAVHRTTRTAMFVQLFVVGIALTIISWLATWVIFVLAARSIRRRVSRDDLATSYPDDERPDHT